MNTIKSKTSKEDKRQVKGGVLLKLSVVVMSATIAVSGVIIQDHRSTIESNQQELNESYEKVEEAKGELVDLNGKLTLVTEEKEDLKTDNEKILEKLSAVQMENGGLKDRNSKLETEVANMELKLTEKKTQVASASPQGTTKTSNPKVSTPAEKKTTSSNGYEGWKKMTVEATGYSLFGDAMGSDGTPQTATGTYPTAGRTIAVDPRVIPYGTKVYIPSRGGVFIAEDTGGMIKGNKIDIYMNHGDEARQWGRKSIEIYVAPSN